MDIIIIAICGVICGADSWVAIETFGKARQEWLEEFLELHSGTRSHDTFGRVFAVIDADEFQTCFVRWVQAVFQVSKGQVIAIDGKIARRSYDKHIGKDAIHMVSAWVSANGIVLGQYKVDEKSNEITAIPELLKILDVSGCIVTIDAMGTQKAIAQSIRDGKGDYVLRVKDNQGKLHQDIQDWFAFVDDAKYAGNYSYHETINKNRGRIEIRRCWALDDPVAFEYIRHDE